jgi:endoglucanase
MKSDTVALIKELVCVAGPSGYEQAVGEIIQREVSSFGEVTTDAIGNIVCEIPGTREDGKRTLFAAHQDEIGFMISGILENGFLRFVPIGGWNPRTLPSSTVDIITAEGAVVVGTIGQIPPHFLKQGADEKPEIDSMSLDIGAESARDVKEVFGVEIGNVAVPSSTFRYDERNGTLMAKAFDDRIGVVALIELGRRVHEKPVSGTVVLAFTTQEEVGLRGATVLSRNVTADAAWIVEGAPADDMPGGPEIPQTCVGKGAHVRIFDPTHIGNLGLLKLARSVARTRGIQIQETVRRGGGTDAAVIALAGKGIPTLVSGVPVRYAHSHVGVASLKDYLSLVDLLYAVVEDSE